MLHRCQNRCLITRRKLVRTYLRAIGDRRFKSKSDFWPWITVSPIEAGRYRVVYLGREVCRTSSFDDFRGTSAPVGIIGSGPSVSSIDISKVARMNCILLNGALSLLERYQINHLATVIEDSTFVEKRFELLKLLPDGSNLIITPGVIRAIAERDSRFLLRMRVYLTQSIVNYSYVPDECFEEERKKATEAHFSFDMDKGYFGGGTVMAVAIQFAFQLGADPTYLFGLDIGNAAEPRFYETPKNRLKCGLLDAYERCILPFMTSASRIFAESGRTIYNCSPTTMLPYDIIPYNDEFRL